MFRGKQDLLSLFKLRTSYQEDIDDAMDHAVLVANLAIRLSKELGFSEDFCTKIADAGILHDIGKMELSDFLYGRKRDVLGIEEIKYVRKHPTLGYEFLCEINKGDDEFRNIILHHHENYDGSGYPDNIMGDGIPIGARILRICDVYAALISERPYRPAFDKDTAMELMIDEVKNFDMNYFLAFMRIVHADDFVEIDDFVKECNVRHKYIVD